MKKLWIIAYLLFSYRCGTIDNHREAAKFAVSGNDSYNIYIYQEDEFDSATALYYSIKDNKKHYLLIDKVFLSNTADYIDGPEDFSSRIVDSLIYITYINHKHVNAIFDLRSRKSSVRLSLATKAQLEWNDSLFKILKKHDSSLVNELN